MRGFFFGKSSESKQTSSEKISSQTKPRIKVVSLTYDISLVSKNERCNIVKRNHRIIKWLSFTTNKKRFDKFVMMIGSRRQSKDLDDVRMNLNNNGSCFHYMPIFFEALKQKISIPCYFDTFLMADLYNSFPSGTSFQKALIPGLKDHAATFDDEYKISMLYAQIHKIACEHPDAEIIFEFYDSKETVIEQMCNDFIINRQWLPVNLTLRIYYYAGFEVNTRLVLPGVGRIDYNYQRTVDDWVFRSKINNLVLDDYFITTSNNNVQNVLLNASLDNTKSPIAIYIEKLQSYCNKMVNARFNKVHRLSCCFANNGESEIAWKLIEVLKLNKKILLNDDEILQLRQNDLFYNAYYFQETLMRYISKNKILLERSHSSEEFRILIPKFEQCLRAAADLIGLPVANEPRMQDQKNYVLASFR